MSKIIKALAGAALFVAVIWAVIATWKHSHYLFLDEHHQLVLWQWEKTWRGPPLP
jgi:hypothetical protein